MTLNRELLNQATSAVRSLQTHYRYGSFRVIRDPEGVVSLWAIEGDPKAPFSISFVEKGRTYSRLEDIPHDFLMAFIEYAQKHFNERI